MHAFVKVESTGWVEVVLVRLSWTTASRHGVVHHLQGAPADRGEPLQKVMADHSSKTYARSSHA
jgi:hypothetical protein